MTRATFFKIIIFKKNMVVADLNKSLLNLDPIVILKIISHLKINRGG
jgi:hypothetical protein